MGEYCSYCGMRLEAALAVEHVKPKAHDPVARELTWSVWYTVFCDDSGMRRRLLAAFPGTHTSCFDPVDGRALPRR